MTLNERRRRVSATKYALKRMKDSARECPGEDEVLLGWVAFFESSFKARLQDGWELSELAAALDMPEA